ncbi:Dicer-like protein 1 [Massospora cicadina]|nr:Dicer-like protein 1 [Massospora cicadina]
MSGTKRIGCRCHVAARTNFWPGHARSVHQLACSMLAPKFLRGALNLWPLAKIRSSSEKSLQRNGIAVLEAGAGETRVAGKLIKEMVQRQPKASKANLEAPHRVAIFLVNIFTLVFQQAKVVEVNVPYRLENLCGVMGANFWLVHRWKEVVNSNDSFVMTAQIFLNKLRHAYISVNVISPLVFDECQHTQKKHPYIFMQEFSHTVPKGLYLPKVFGITALPLGRKVRVITASGSLERILDAHIYTICTQDVLRSFVSCPKEIVVTFAPNPNSNPATPDTDHVLPRAQMLLKALQAYKISDFYGIIFVEWRCVATAIKLLIQKVAAAELGYLNYGCLLGHGEAKSAYGVRISFAQQNCMLQGFKTGTVNLLVATRVAKEGIDIQPCNMVIHFGFLPNLISYIQLRGRVRPKKSVYILMQEQGKVVKASLVRKPQRDEEAMLTLCHSLTVEEELDPNIVKLHIYSVPETGATTKLEFLIVLLFNFCSLPSKDNYCVPLPHFNLMRNNLYYKYTALLPNCLLKRAFGGLASSKTRATQSCKLLDFWLDDGCSWQEFYVNVVDTNHLNVTLGMIYCPFVVITHKPLPKFNPFEMFFDSTPANLTVLSVTDCMTPSAVMPINKQLEFTAQAIYAILHKKPICEIDTTMYLLVTLTLSPEDASLVWEYIDWKLVRDVGQLEPIDLCSPTEDLVICDAVDNLHQYYVKGSLTTCLHIA